MVAFSPNTKILAVQNLVDELLTNVFYDEEIIYLSDEAKLWDVASSDVEEALDRCRKYYGVSLSLEETQRFPLWQLLPLLKEKQKIRDR